MRLTVLLGLVVLLVARPVMAVTLQPGDILVVDESAFGGSGGIIKVDPVTRAQETISSGGLFVDPRGIVLDSTGQIIVADPNAFGGGGGLIRVDPTTGGQTPISSGDLFADPLAVAVEASGSLVVADAGLPGGTGSVIRVDPATGGQELVSTGDLFVDPHGITIDATGMIIVADHDGSLIKVDPTHGTQTLIASGENLSRLVHVTLDAVGDIIVASNDEAVIRVDPATGDQAVVSKDGLFADPSGVAMDPVQNILVADVNAFGGSGGVIRVDPVSRVQDPISSGGSFVDPQGIAVVTGSPAALLTFPLKGTKGRIDVELNAHTAPVTSVFDHNVSQANGRYYYRCDGVVQAFNPSDRGTGNPAPCKQNAYPHPFGIHFSANGHYVGNDLNYDGHPGIDYRARCGSPDAQQYCTRGTNVYAAAKGTIHYPATVVGLCYSKQDCASWGVMELRPDATPNLRAYSLHLATYEGTAGFVATDPSPAPGCPSLVSLPLLENDEVEAGCLIAQSGNTSPPTKRVAQHLHFEVQRILPRGMFPPSLWCTANGAPMACVPVDPYGWAGGACTPDPYVASPGVSNTILWRDRPYLSTSGRCFPDQTVGTTSTPQVVTLTNVAAQNTLTIASIELTGKDPNDFAVNGCLGALTPGQSCMLSMTFSPTSTGSRSAIVVISGSDGGYPPDVPAAVTLAVSVTGNGT